MKFWLAAAFAVWSVGIALSAEPGPLALEHLGHRDFLHPGSEPREVETFMLSLGDTSVEDRKLSQRDPKLMPFILDAAQYAPAADGTWFVHQFRMPRLDALPGNDSRVFLDFLRRSDVRAALQDIYVREDFGRPGDFIYRRMGLRREELPAPFNRLSAQDLEPIQTIFQYNHDGTMHVKLKDPYDEDGRAQKVLEDLKAAISAP